MCSCASGERAEEARSRLAQKAFAEGKQLFDASDVWVPGFPDIRRIGNLHEVKRLRGYLGNVEAAAAAAPGEDEDKDGWTTFE